MHPKVKICKEQHCFHANQDGERQNIFLFQLCWAKFSVNVFHEMKNQNLSQVQNIFGCLWGHNWAATSGLGILNANISLGKYANMHLFKIINSLLKELLLKSFIRCWCHIKQGHLGTLVCSGKLHEMLWVMLQYKVAFSCVNCVELCDLHWVTWVA